MSDNMAALRINAQTVAQLTQRLRRSIGSVDAKSWQKLLQRTLLVYIWGRHGLEIAACFLQSATNSAKSMEECCEEVVGMYRSAATDWLVRLSIEPPPGAAFKAAQFVVSYRLFHWLQQQNEKGVAPRRRDLVAQALESFPEGMPLESLCKFKHTLRHKRSQNQWLRRFRLQWNARLAKLPVLPPLPLHLRQEKVRCYFAFFLRLFFFPGPRASLLLGSG